MSNVARHDWWRASETAYSECPNLAVAPVVFSDILKFHKNLEPRSQSESACTQCTFHSPLYELIFARLIQSARRAARFRSGLIKNSKKNRSDI
jgi:hypothetical protein